MGDPGDEGNVDDFGGGGNDGDCGGEMYCGDGPYCSDILRENLAFTFGCESNCDGGFSDGGGAEYRRW